MLESRTERWEPRRSLMVRKCSAMYVSEKWPGWIGAECKWPEALRINLTPGECQLDCRQQQFIPGWSQATWSCRISRCQGSGGLQRPELAINPCLVEGALPEAQGPQSARYPRELTKLQIPGPHPSDPVSGVWPSDLHFSQAPLVIWFDLKDSEMHSWLP